MLAVHPYHHLLCLQAIFCSSILSLKFDAAAVFRSEEVVPFYRGPCSNTSLAHLLFLVLKFSMLVENGSSMGLSNDIVEENKTKINHYFKSTRSGYFQQNKVFSTIVFYICGHTIVH
jgi:hypothetical protein